MPMLSTTCVATIAEEVFCLPRIVPENGACGSYEDAEGGCVVGGCRVSDGAKAAPHIT